MNVKGYAAHFGVANYNGELVKPHSFQKWAEDYKVLSEEVGYSIPINLNHNGEKPIGKITSVAIDEVGVYITADISDTMIDRYNLRPIITDGDMDAFSTEGYIDRDTMKINDDGTYTANGFYLVAVALVCNPADPNAIFKTNSIAAFGKYADDPKTKEKVLTNNLLFL